MPWVPLQDSAVSYTFNNIDGSAVLADSVVSLDNAQSPGWLISNDATEGEFLFRITVQAYSADTGGLGQTQVAVFDWNDAAGDPFQQSNESGEPDVSFDPSQVEGAVGFGQGLSYTPASGSEWAVSETYQYLIEVWEEGQDTSYNCECDDENDNETLGQLKNKMMHLLGWGATAANPPPGVAQMLTYWLQDAQAMLYRRFTQLRTERFFSWPLVQGVRMYDLPDNQEVCTKKLDPRKLTWVGIERDGVWVPLISSIPPELYSYNTTGYPVRYEIRQCIEVWPTPDATLGNLIIKGHFGLEPFAADGDKTTIDSLPVFQVALANAKAHYRQPDANNYIQQMEALIRDLTAGLHGTRRYIPGRRVTEERVYIEPRPTVPFANS